MKKPELLCPAGNMIKLKTALRYGADAVYIGGNFFGLRARANNFTPEEMREAISYAHSLGKKVYVTMNILSRNEDLEAEKEYAKELYEMKADGVIVSDLGTVMMVRETVPELPIHVSTQANNLNWLTCKTWIELGCERVNLARELSLSEISDINVKLRESGIDCDSHIRLEAFCHGAMCMSFSGRCMLSDYMTGRSSNRGDCAQPCRWNYHIVEEHRPVEYMPIEENERGTFIFNSKDMFMIEYLPEMLASGVGSLKIEGRMKIEYYTAVTVSVYRRAIDMLFENPEGYKKAVPEFIKELCMVSHRDYTTGFYLGLKGEQVYSTSSYMRDSDYIGIVKECGKNDNGTYRICLSQRGNFKKGDLLDFLVPNKAPESHRVSLMYNDKGEEIESAPHAMMDVVFDIPFEAPAETLVRRKKTGE